MVVKGRKAQIVLSGLAAFLGGLTILLFGAAKVYATPSAVLYVVPDKTTVKQGEMLTVKFGVRVDEGSFTAADVTAKWPTDTFEYSSVSYAGSNLKVACPGGLYGDYRRFFFCQSSDTDLTGDQLLGTLSFKALRGSGTTEIGFNEGENSIALNDNGTFKYYPLTLTSATVSFTSPPPPPTPASNQKENGELPESISTSSPSTSSGDQSAKGSSDVGSTGVSPDIDSNATVAAKKASKKTGLWVVLGLALATIAAVAVWFFKFRSGKKLVGKSRPTTKKNL